MDQFLISFGHFRYGGYKIRAIFTIFNKSYISHLLSNTHTNFINTKADSDDEKSHNSLQ